MGFEAAMIELRSVVVVSVGVPHQHSSYTMPVRPLHETRLDRTGRLVPEGSNLRTNKKTIPRSAGRCTGSPGEVGRRRGDGAMEEPELLSVGGVPSRSVLEALDLIAEVLQHRHVGDRGRDLTTAPSELRPELLDPDALTEGPTEEGEGPLLGGLRRARCVADRFVGPTIGDLPDEIGSVDGAVLHTLHGARAPVPELVAPHRDPRGGEPDTAILAPVGTLTPAGNDVVTGVLRADEAGADDLDVLDGSVLLVLAAKQAIHDVIDMGVGESKAGVTFSCHSFLRCGYTIPWTAGLCMPAVGASALRLPLPDGVTAVDVLDPPIEALPVGVVLIALGPGVVEPVLTLRALVVNLEFTGTVEAAHAAPTESLLHHDDHIGVEHLMEGRPDVAGVAVEVAVDPDISAVSGLVSDR